MNRSKTISALGALVLTAAYMASESTASAGGYIEAGVVGNAQVFGEFAPRGGVCSACSVFGSYYQGLPGALPRVPVQHQVPVMPVGPSGWVNNGYFPGNGFVGGATGGYPYPVPVPVAGGPCGGPCGGGAMVGGPVGPIGGGGIIQVGSVPSYEQYDMAGIIMALGTAMPGNTNVYAVAPQRNDLTIPAYPSHHGDRVVGFEPRLGFHGASSPTLLQ